MLYTRNVYNIVNQLYLNFFKKIILVQNKQIILQNDLLIFTNSTMFQSPDYSVNLGKNQFSAIMQTLVKTYKFCGVTR